MDVIEIIKDAFVFPSKNLGTFAIYLVLSILAGAFAVGGAFLYILGFIDPESLLSGGIALIIAMVIGWVLYGYQISVIKSGIELEDDVPNFKWWDNFITGFDNFIVSVVYFLVPAFLVLYVGLLTDIFGNVVNVVQEIISLIVDVSMGTSIDIALNAISQSLMGLVISLAITITVALVLFIIFSFLQTMAQARLANTGSLSEALNIFEAAKDIKRIGIIKVIVLIVLVGVIVGIIEMILGFLPILSILSIIVSPYLILFTQRAVGLLYSDIA